MIRKFTLIKNVTLIIVLLTVSPLLFSQAVIRDSISISPKPSPKGVSNQVITSANSGSSRMEITIKINAPGSEPVSLEVLYKNYCDGDYPQGHVYSEYINDTQTHQFTIPTVYTHVYELQLRYYGYAQTPITVEATVSLFDTVYARVIPFDPVDPDVENYIKQTMGFHMATGVLLSEFQGLQFELPSEIAVHSMPNYFSYCPILSNGIVDPWEDCRGVWRVNPVRSFCSSALWIPSTDGITFTITEGSEYASFYSIDGTRRGSIVHEPVGNAGKLETYWNPDDWWDVWLMADNNPDTISPVTVEIRGGTVVQTRTFYVKPIAADHFDMASLPDSILYGERTHLSIDAKKSNGENALLDEDIGQYTKLLIKAEPGGYGHFETASASRVISGAAPSINDPRNKKFRGNKTLPENVEPLPVREHKKRSKSGSNSVETMAEISQITTEAPPESLLCTYWEAMGLIYFVADGIDPDTNTTITFTIRSIEDTTIQGTGSVVINSGKKKLHIENHEPSEIWPYLPPQNNGESRGADRVGYNPKRSFEIKVTDAVGNPLENEKVTIFAKYEIGTGGHGHKGFANDAGTIEADTILPTKLQGTFYSGTNNSGKNNKDTLQLTTDADGIAKVDSFRASEASGKYLITAWLTSDTTVFDTVNMQIKVPDFVEFGDGTYWNLTGTASKRGKNHLSNHWCTQKTKDSIEAAIQEFYEWTLTEDGGKNAVELGINDMCLNWGGAFDIPGTWKFGNEHSFHRVGVSVDIDNADLKTTDPKNPKEKILTKRGKQLVEIMKKYGGYIFDEGPIHFGFNNGK